MRQRLRDVRLSKGYTDVEKISFKIGISASYYYKIEQGIRTPSVNLAKRIADIFDKTVDDIFFDQNLDETSNDKQAI